MYVHKTDARPLGALPEETEIYNTGCVAAPCSSSLGAVLQQPRAPGIRSYCEGNIVLRRDAHEKTHPGNVAVRAQTKERAYSRSQVNRAYMRKRCFLMYTVNGYRVALVKIDASLYAVCTLSKVINSHVKPRKQDPRVCIRFPFFRSLQM